MGDTPPGGWNPAWRKLRDDVNLLAWLFEEERVITRLYIESAFWATTGKKYTAHEFAKDLGLGLTNQGPPYDPQRPAARALDRGGEGESPD